MAGDSSLDWKRLKTAVFYTLGLPIALILLLRFVLRRLCRPDWHRAGLAIATAGLGNLSLRLWEPPRTTRARSTAAAMGAWLSAIGGLAWLASGGWWAILLIPYLRQGRRLRAAPLLPPEPDWPKQPLLFRLAPLDYASLGVIAVLASLLWFGRGSLVPMAPDGYYHALVVRRIVEDGAIPLWDWWQYAPQGRPHLYPPLLHVLMALCSLAYGGNVLAGMRVAFALLPPAALLTTWYAARWLFNAPRAFLAVLLLGMDMMFMLLGMFGLPSILANAILPLALVFFLGRRLLPAALAMAAALYAHLGVGPLGILGLFLFSLWDRRYLRFFALAGGLALLLALPWYGHIWLHRDWLGHPMRNLPIGWPAATLFKLLWLLHLNLLVVMLVVRAARLFPWRESRYGLLITQVVAFLPMLLQYGGRYFMHTIPVWAIFAAIPLERFLHPPLRRRRVVLFILLALCPTLLLLNADDRPLKLQPMISGWIVPAMSLATHGPIFDEEEPKKVTWRQAQELSAAVRELTNEDDVLHLMGNAELGVALAWHTGRRIDTAAWPEVRREGQVGELARMALRDERGLFVVEDTDLLPQEAEVVRQVGRFYLARVRLVDGAE